MRNRLPAGDFATSRNTSSDARHWRSLRLGQKAWAGPWLSHAKAGEPPCRRAASMNATRPQKVTAYAQTSLVTPMSVKRACVGGADETGDGGVAGRLSSRNSRESDSCFSCSGNSDSTSCTREKMLCRMSRRTNLVAPICRAARRKSGKYCGPLERGSPTDLYNILLSVHAHRSGRNTPLQGKVSPAGKRAGGVQLNQICAD